jgi:hypothetical protein
MPAVQKPGPQMMRRSRSWRAARTRPTGSGTAIPAITSHVGIDAGRRSRVKTVRMIATMYSGDRIIV